MKLLLDSHVLLWWLEDHPKLGNIAREAISDPSNQVSISVASIWEMSIKEAKGLLRLAHNFDARLVQLPFLSLAISYAHVRKAAALSLIHKDPFDRLLAAQCLLEGLTLVTGDRLLQRYGISIIEAV